MRLQLAVPGVSRATWASGNFAVLYLLTSKKIPTLAWLDTNDNYFFFFVPFQALVSGLGRRNGGV